MIIIFIFISVHLELVKNNKHNSNFNKLQSILLLMTTTLKNEDMKIVTLKILFCTIKLNILL